LLQRERKFLKHAALNINEINLVAPRGCARRAVNPLVVAFEALALAA